MPCAPKARMPLGGGRDPRNGCKELAVLTEACWEPTRRWRCFTLVSSVFASPPKFAYLAVSTALGEFYWILLTGHDDRNCIRVASIERPQSQGSGGCPRGSVVVCKPIDPIDVVQIRRCPSGRSPPRLFPFAYVYQVSLLHISRQTAQISGLHHTQLHRLNQSIWR